MLLEKITGYGQNIAKEHEETTPRKSCPE